MKVEEEFIDVLQNIEFEIVQLYREQSDLLNYNVMRSLEAAVGFYKSVQRQQTPKEPALDDLDSRAFKAVMSICEWRLGHQKLERHPVSNGRQLTVDEIVLCLKRLLKSVETRNKTGGRQGYLQFVNQHL